MEYVSKTPVWKMSFVDSFLSALQTVPGGPLIGATPKVHLYTGPLVPTPGNVMADFLALECTFTGYVAAGLNIQALHLNANLNVRAALGIAMFFLSGSAVTQNANGYWVDAGASPDWIVAERFTAPVPFANPGDFLQLSPMLPQLLKFSM